MSMGMNGRGRRRRMGIGWGVLAGVTILGGIAATAQEGGALGSTAQKETAGRIFSVTELEQSASPVTEALRGSAPDGIFSDEMIAPPATNEAATVLQAIRIAADLAGRRLVLASTNGLESLSDEYIPPFQGRCELGEFVSELLPEGLEFWDRPADPERRADVRRLYIGPVGEINRKRIEHDSEKLANNHTRIAFTANGMSLHSAIMQIRDLARAPILTSYMDEADRIPDSARGTNEVVGVSEFVSATNTVSQASKVYVSIPEKMEWRNVLTAVLDPLDYAFDEKDGFVRVARKVKFDEWKRQEVEAKPLVSRIVRVYHANPEEIVAKLNELDGVKVGANAKIMVAPYQETAEKASKSARLNMQSGSSTLSTGAGSAAGDTQGSQSSAWGDLMRPKNPPAILLHDIEENLPKLEAIVRSMDVREKQVLIEALVLDLGDEFMKEFGVNWAGFENIGLGQFGWVSGKGYQKTRTTENSYDWDRTDAGASVQQGHSSRSLGSDFDTWSSSSDSTRTIRESFTDVAGNVTKTARASGTETVGVLGPLDFSAVLKMVQKDENNRVLSCPVLTLGDHAESMIHVGRIVPVANLETSYLGENNDNVQVQVEWMEIVTGMLIWVGPEITEDGGQVRLWVHPKHVDLTGNWEEVKLSPTDPYLTRYPEMTSSEMDTRVTVPSGNTLLLGGLTRVEEVDGMDKIPILGDIPFLGRLFRNKVKTKQTRNLVILIRPTILDHENPNSGFEDPAMKIIDPMMSRAGRNLALPEEDRKMETREDRIKRVFNWRKDDEADAVPAEGENATDETPAASAPPPVVEVVPGKVEG